MINVCFTICLNSRVDIAFLPLNCSTKTGSFRALMSHVLGLIQNLIFSRFLQTRKGKMTINWRQPQMAETRKGRKGQRIWTTWKKKSTWWVHKQPYSIIILRSWLRWFHWGKMILKPCKVAFYKCLYILNYVWKEKAWNWITFLNYWNHVLPSTFPHS